MTTGAAGSRWNDLLALALVHLDSVGVNRRQWTWGGGTVLMLRHRHRLSWDIDLFLHDVQTLTHLSPRLNDSVAATVDFYTEQANHLRCVVNEIGEIDYLVAAPVIDLDPETMSLAGHGIVQVMSDREILAQKIHYRATAFKGRDLFDFVTVTTKRPDLLADADLHEIGAAKRAVLGKRLASDLLEVDYAAVRRFDNRVERMPFGEARNRMLRWLREPPPPKEGAKGDEASDAECAAPQPFPFRDRSDPFRTG